MDIHQLFPQPFEWCDIPAGDVTIQYGEWDEGVYCVNRTQDFHIEKFRMAKYPVTNSQYDIFIHHPDGYQNMTWWDFSDDAQKWRAKNPQAHPKRLHDVNAPRIYISWYEAIAYCRFLSNLFGENIMIPSEQQWQRAAIDDTGWSYPYGDKFDANKCNFNTSSPTPVTRYKGLGDSPYGVVDMTGNVWEWCLNDMYGLSNLTINQAHDGCYYVIRGGAWLNNTVHRMRADVRAFNNPYHQKNIIGMRLILSP